MLSCSAGMPQLEMFAGVQEDYIWICRCVFVHIIKKHTWHMHVNDASTFQWNSADIIRTVLDFLCRSHCCLSVPGLLSGGSWQTSPAGCCVRPELQRRPSTPVPAVLRSAGSAGRRSGPIPGAGSLPTWSDWCSHTHSVVKERQRNKIN